MKSSRVFGSLILVVSALISIDAAWSQTVDSTQITTPASPASATHHRPLVGLALGGGGARGAAEVGVLQVFKEQGVPIDMIAGTSIGSVVGGLYDAGVPIDELASKFTDSGIMKAFMPIPISMRIVLAPVIYLPRLLGARPYDGLYKGKIFRNYANGLAKSETDIEKLPIPFAAVCTNLVDGKAYRISKGNLGHAMQASVAVPGLKKPVQIGDNLFCDGGLVDNVPVKQVREMGADFVIAVDIDEALKPVPLDNFRQPGSVSKQALRIQLASQDGPACCAADFVIHPDTDGISLISRNKKDGHRGIQSGIDAARAAMPELKRKLAAIGIIITPQTSVSAK